MGYWIYRKKAKKMESKQTKNPHSNSDEFKQAICRESVSMSLNFHTSLERTLKYKNSIERLIRNKLHKIFRQFITIITFCTSTTHLTKN